MSESDDMAAYREVFESESREFLQLMNDALLRLESAPSDLAPVDEVFRAAHSLKGMAAAMGYESIAEVAHHLENLVDTVRKRERGVTSALVDILLAGCDGLGEAITEATAGAVDEEALGALQGRIREAMEAPAAAPATGGANRYTVTVTLDEACALRSVRAYMVLKRLSQIGDIVDTKPSVADIEDERFELTFEAMLTTEAPAETVEAAALEISEVASAEVQAAEVPKERRAVPRAPRVSDTQTVRVSVGHIDEMVNLVGELVIVRSRLARIAASLDDLELGKALEELGRVGTALQQVVLRTRMVPVEQIFNRFPRMIRDLANELDKKVEFEMDGLDIELDRTVLDEIGDPLVHLLRNAVGHGAESEAARRAAGKDPTAHIRLSAVREKSAVSIIVEDDGQGINLDAVKAKAVERGVVTPERANEMSEEEACALICAPGLSTAQATTELSGRGVGLDAVKEKIEQLGGTLVISSAYGEGTRFTLSLPLTLAIVQALLLEDAGHVYAVPMANVVEAHAIDELTVKTVRKAPVAVIGERVIPLKPLQEALGKQAGDGQATQAILVAWRETETGLLVERLLGKHEVVIKPLPSWLRGAKGVAGATVLGDGRVALIVDVRSLIGQEVR